MSTFAEVLAAQLRRDPGRPLVTFYDHATDERVELSVTTYANWVAKASGLLTDVADLERGMSLRIDLPPHWLSTVFLGAAWTVGLRVRASGGPDGPDDVDAVVCGPESLAAWAPAAGRMPVLACSLRPLGVRFAEPLPPGVLDVGVEIWGQPDGFTAWDPPTGDDPATETLTQDQLWDHDLTAAVGSSLTDGGRLLSVADPASPPGTSTFTEPLGRGGSLILVRNPDPARLDGVYDTERATARA